ncbi:hypothetical protein QQ008_27245 [Fulvivirgaceae bacterium BMA10]|uniref:Auto-transporter adhesin head GIN domain-containing protein n=1 Tax=Splendidivirga corallicola TaxID=3051826 RepID=A0ABT8KZV5_9BACT|nr:hypothetical protein [Fulvivirgaceae bacterium BMA10]
MKNIQLIDGNFKAVFSILLFVVFMSTACNKEEACEMNNTGMIEITQQSSRYTTSVPILIDGQLQYRSITNQTESIEVQAGIHQVLIGSSRTPIYQESVEVSSCQTKSIFF